jgi:hypothetical protein
MFVASGFRAKPAGEQLGSEMTDDFCGLRMHRARNAALQEPRAVARVVGTPNRRNFP